MAIHVSCSSCREPLQVEDAMAGREVQCPRCRQWLTIPSITAERPEPRRGDLDRGAGFSGSGRGDLERGGRGGDWDDDEPSQRRWPEEDEPRPPRGVWDMVQSGLSLIFWSLLFLIIIVEVFMAVVLALGGNPEAFMMGGDPNQAVGLQMGIFVGACVVLILAVIAFVGMCMCCTVPPESGAKGKAVTAVVLVITAVVLGIILILVLVLTAMNLARGGGMVGMPLTGGTMLALNIGTFLFNILLWTLWLMFHKAIADYFHNDRLSSATVWFVVVYVFTQLVSETLYILAYKDVLFGNMLGALPDRTLNLASVVWGMITLAGMSIWYLLILKETQRTIREEQPGERYSY